MQITSTGFGLNETGLFLILFLNENNIIWRIFFIKHVELYFLKDINYP